MDGEYHRFLCRPQILICLKKIHKLLTEKNVAGAITNDIPSFIFAELMSCSGATSGFQACGIILSTPSQGHSICRNMTCFGCMSVLRRQFAIKLGLETVYNKQESNPQIQGAHDAKQSSSDKTSAVLHVMSEMLIQAQSGAPVVYTNSSTPRYVLHATRVPHQTCMFRSVPSKKP